MFEYHLIAAFFALLLPVSLFVSRSAIKSQRSAVYNDIIRTLFPENNLPQLDLVGAKYGAINRPTTSTALLPGANREPFALVLAAFLYTAVTFIGFELLLVPINQLVGASASKAHGYELVVRQAFFWTSGALRDQPINNVVAVAAMAFLGGYIAAARFLVRQTMNYELNGMSFMRCTVQLIIGVIVAVVAFRALTNGAEFIAQRPPAACSQIGSIACSNFTPGGWWLGAAFLLGMSPEAGLAWVSRQLRLTLQKPIDFNIYDAAKVVPIEIIDGIDSPTAFRLEENTIEDVQNLATANPIMLCIESPFGLFEVFDWVLQAQLCVVVGPDAFITLKKHNIRTIFDLERAVLADDVSDAYVQAIGEVVFAKADPAFRDRLAAKDQPIPATVVRHAVAVITDDLHVHRLRALWQRIQERSGTDAGQCLWLYRRTPLPGDPKYAGPA